VSVHPYREPPEPAAPPEVDSVRLDAEEWVVYGVLTVTGAVGILVGLLGSRSTELVLGGLLLWLAVWSVVSEVCARMRTDDPHA
jgi:hypothetical protein